MNGTLTELIGRTSLLGRIRERRAELALALRVTVAAVLSFAVSDVLHVPLPLWTVLTAVILTQATFGSSLKVTIDYLAGTFFGAVYGGAVAIFVPQESELARAAVLALTVAPLALLGGLKPSFSTATFTGVLVLMVPQITHVSPLESSVYRIIEVAVGALAGLVASMVVFPTRAHNLLVEAAARMLELMAQAISELIAALTEGRDQAASPAFQDRIGELLARSEALAAQARHERIGILAAKQQDSGPLLRTLLRLRHDLVIIGRAAAVPLPEVLQKRMGPALQRIAAIAAELLRDMADALLAGRQPPSLETFEASLEDFTKTFAGIRQDRLTVGLPVETVERIFALGFALEQLRDHLRDLHRYLRESANRS